MTALAYTLNPLPLNPPPHLHAAPEPDLDYFDNEAGQPHRRPELRLVTGSGPITGPITDAPARPIVVADRAQPAQPSQAALSVEVYRRRRFFVLAAVTALVLSIALASGVSVLSFGSAAATADPVDPAIPAVHVVMPGDSYAAIAAGFGAADPVNAGEHLRAANGDSELVVGQRLVIDLATFAAAA